MQEQPVKLEGFGAQDLYQRREKIYTRAIGGFFQRVRLYSGWPLLIGYFVLPWLTYENRQAVLFDLPARQFHIFGLTFWPQDLWLLGWMLMISAFALFAVTTMVGRLWCGYTCPQTVWTAIFMWIEQVTEGSRHQRIRLDAAPWSIDKFRKRFTKHTMWLVVGFLTGLTFVGYFAPLRELAAALTTPLQSITSGVYSWSFFWIGFFTLATYINAGWLREQICIYMCPYARFQSAMIDNNTLTVAYDYKRGEPRGSRKRSSTREPEGDCIDCTLCVQVCPTGIDIREGLQYECIGCAQCIDACNQVMAQMNSPAGLIRYTSELELSGGKSSVFRPRSLGYIFVTAALTAAFGWAVLQRSSFAADIIRDRDALYQRDANGQVRNDYQLVMFNKLQKPQTLTISLQPTSAPAQASTAIKIASKTTHTLAPGGAENVPLSLTGSASGPYLTPIQLRICSNQNSECSIEETSFFRPAETTQAGGR